MAQRNYLVEGVSCSGKSSVCRELSRRGYEVIDGDNQLAYQGDPETGKPIETRTRSLAVHRQHLWEVEKVRSLAESGEEELAFFCGGSRNFAQFLACFERVFVLQVDRETLIRRLEARPPDEWGGNREEKELVLRLHATQEDVPEGTPIDATRPLSEVVDRILACALRPS